MSDTKTPKYTDAHRWTHGYTPAAATDIRRTFERVRAQIRRSGEDPLDPSTWAEHTNPSTDTRSTKD